MLHNQLDVVPVDKVSGNVASFCQRHCAQVLVNELRLHDADNATIKPVDKIASDNILILKKN